MPACSVPVLYKIDTAKDIQHTACTAKDKRWRCKKMYKDVMFKNVPIKKILKDIFSCTCAMPCTLYAITPCSCTAKAPPTTFHHAPRHFSAMYAMPKPWCTPFKDIDDTACTKRCTAKMCVRPCTIDVRHYSFSLPVRYDILYEKDYKNKNI